MSEADEIFGRPQLKKKTCAELALEYVNYFKQVSPNFNTDWAIKFEACSDFPGPKKKKQVWQWKQKGSRNNWFVMPELMTEEDSKNSANLLVKHAGPFEVEE